MKKTRISKILIGIIMAAIAVIQVYPLIWLVLFSFKTNDEIFGQNVMGLPKHWLWSNYKSVLIDGSLGRYFFNSVFVTFVTIIISGILAAMVSYAIVRMTVKINKLVMILFSLGLMIPYHAALLPIFIILRDMKMLSTYQALIIPYVAYSLPMAIFILSAFFQTLPRSMEEAAFIDGSSLYGAFFKIMLPLVRPAIAAVSIFTFLFAWNEMMFSITFISKTEFRTLSVGILQMVGQYKTNWGAIGAGLLVATLPAILLYIVFSEQVQKSLTAGAVKG